MTFTAWISQEQFIAWHRAAFRNGAHEAYRLYVETTMLWADGVIDQYRTIDYYVQWFKRAEGFCKTVEVERIKNAFRDL